MAISKMETSRDFFRILFFWKRQALLTFLLIVCSVMLYAYTTNPIYESSAAVLIHPKTNEGEVISSGSAEKLINPVTSSEVFTQMELLSSDPVLRKTIYSFGKAGLGLKKGGDDSSSNVFSTIFQTVKKLLRLVNLEGSPISGIEGEIFSFRQKLTVEAVKNSNIIRIALKAEDPKNASIVLNRLLKFYLEHYTTIYLKKDALGFYDYQSTIYEKKLDIVEKRIKEFEKKGNIVNLEIQNKSNIELLSKLNSNLKLLEIVYDEKNATISMLKEDIRNEANALLLTKEMRQISAIIELEKGIVPLLVRRSEISMTFSQSSREHKAINDQIEMLRGEIRIEINKAIRTEELELKGMEIKVWSLREQIKVLQQEANDFNQKDKELQELKRQAQMHQASYMLYSNKTENAKIIAEKTRRDLANVTVSSAPKAPKRPIFPNRLLMLVLSIFFGSFVSFFVPFLLESIDSKIKTIDDVENLLDLKVISSFLEVKPTSQYRKKLNFNA